MEKQIYISIVIPTYNMLGKIKNLMHSIEKQKYDRSKFEVIIVDNGSTDGTREYMGEYYPWIKVLRENIPNMDKARNRGISDSSGNIIAITDADCVLNENWLQVIENNFLDNNCDIITGRFIHGSSFLEKIIALTNFSDFQSDRPCMNKNFVGGNFAMKAEILKEYRFPETGLGGDRLLSWKLYKKGYRILYQPNLIVYHKPDCSFAKVVKRMMTYGNDTIRIRRTDKTLPGGFLIRFIYLAPFFYAGVRFIIDTKNLFKHRKILNINIFAIPFYIATFTVIRTIYFFGMFQELLSNQNNK